MKILMSAFSCGPGLGSEPGIGWNIAIETARLGYDVHVLTQNEFRNHIKREIDSKQLPENLRFDIFMPSWLEWLRDTGLKTGYETLTWHVTHFLWQLCALSYVRRHYSVADFDVVHHVTFGMIRHPTLLGRLGRPTVVGPIGGGERAPMALRKSLGWRDWSFELLRDFCTVALRADPFTRSAYRDAGVIILRTKESAIAVPPRYRHKITVHVGLGIAELVEGTTGRRSQTEPLQLLYAGRLLHWKGVHLALRALERARAKGADVRLTLVGDGPARASLERLAHRLGITSHVVWCGHVPRIELLQIYGTHHALLFPSLHDSGGMVIVEAWAHGLPVICLALGGPGQLVDNTCGRVIPVAGSEEDCVEGLSAAIAELADDDELRLRLSQCSVQRHRKFLWPRVVSKLYSDVRERLADRLPES